MREKTALETKLAWKAYYESLAEGDESGVFKEEFSKYVGTHTWNNSVRVINEYGAINDGDSVLDAGCGWGRMLLGLLEKHHDLNVTAVDLTAEALKTGENIIGNNRNGNKINWISGDLQNLELADESFDVVYSSRVLQHLNAPEKGVSELMRVLKKNGRFVFFLQNKLCPLNYSYYSRLYTPFQVRNWFSGLDTHELHVASMDFYPHFIKMGLSEQSQLNFERVLEKFPLLNLLGGKVLVWGTK